VTSIDNDVGDDGVLLRKFIVYLIVRKTKTKQYSKLVTGDENECYE